MTKKKRKMLRTVSEYSACVWAATMVVLWFAWYLFIPDGLAGLKEMAAMFTWLYVIHFTALVTMTVTFVKSVKGGRHDK